METKIFLLGGYRLSEYSSSNLIFGVLNTLCYIFFFAVKQGKKVSTKKKLKRPRDQQQKTLVACSNMQTRVGSHLSFSDDSDDEHTYNRPTEPREQTNLLDAPPLTWRTIILYSIGPLGVDSANLVVGMLL